jgi:hypothetical protein
MHLDVPRRSHDGLRYIIGNAYVIAQSDAAKSRGRKGSRSIAVLARAGGRVVAEGDGERQQVTLRPTLVIVHQQAAEASVEALVFPEDLVGTDRSGRERDGERDDERQALVQGDELVGESDDPVSEFFDEPGVRGSGVVQY